MVKRIKEMTHQEIDSICKEYFIGCFNCPLNINIHEDKKVCYKRLTSDVINVEDKLITIPDTKLEMRTKLLSERNEFKMLFEIKNGLLLLEWTDVEYLMLRIKYILIIENWKKEKNINTKYENGKCYEVTFNDFINKIDIEDYQQQISGNIIYDTEEHAKQAIDLIGRDNYIKYILGVRDYKPKGDK